MATGKVRDKKNEGLYIPYILGLQPRDKAAMLVVYWWSVQ